MSARRRPGRADREHGSSGGSGDDRTPFQKDRDRILYAPAFRRLGGVTQVASPSEGQVFHNRLSHSLEVAQIARRLCETLLINQTGKAFSIGLDWDSPDIVEAAALAHDLGHPPFGHLAEKMLARLASERLAGVSFEGNAQSFRILTVLSPLKPGQNGLDLTQATLNATLKYPWLFGRGPRPDKWGAYLSERPTFLFARAGDASNRKSAEAMIMDIADDIAYSTHDVVDFYRAGLIPLEGLADQLAEEVRDLQTNSRKVSPAEVDRHHTQLEDLANILEISRFTGRTEDISFLSLFTSTLITRFFGAVAITASGTIEMDEAQRVEVAFLQNLVWRYVINNPRLATQQEGQRRIIRDLFEIYSVAIAQRRTTILPPQFSSWFESTSGAPLRLGPEKSTRLAIDIIASFTDQQAWSVHRRLTGASMGSFADILYM
jgi:dGTPase